MRKKVQKVMLEILAEPITRVSKPESGLFWKAVENFGRASQTDKLAESSQ